MNQTTSDERLANNKKALVLTIILCFALPVCADEHESPVYGRSMSYTADFLNLGAGARALGMGGAGIATTHDATATYWNPAGIGHRSGIAAKRPRYELSLMRSTLSGVAAYTFVGYSHPISQESAIGISWLRVGVDDIPLTGLTVASKPVGPTNRPKVIGTFSNTDNAFLLAGGWKLPSPHPFTFRLGGALKLLYIDSYRKTNAIGGGGDIGFLMTLSDARRRDIPAPTPRRTRLAKRSEAGVVRQITLGIRACDIFTTKLYWNTPPATEGETPHTETILPNFKFGIAGTHPLPFLGSTLTLACDANTQHGLELHAGAELTLFELLALRIGTDGRNGTERIMQVTAGVGLQLRFLTGASAAVDYAWTNHPALGGSHRMSFQMGF